MRTSVIPCGDARWDKALARLPHADVYFSPAWQVTGTAALGDGKPILFTAEDGEDLLAHPTLMRTIPGAAHHRDFETAYGYGGPVATTTDAAFLARAWEAYAGFAREAGGVAEFIRCHPLLGNERLLAGSAEVLFDRETVVVDLSGGRDGLLQRSAGQHRRNLKKAEAAGISVSRVDIERGMPAFRAIYQQTMARAGASAFYHFGDAYFEALTGLGPERLALFIARRNEAPIAGALVLLSAPTLHYHLGGAFEDDLSLRPMNALFQGIFEWGQANAYERIHLGGGRRPEADDSLLRFKGTLGRDRARYFIAKRVLDPAGYETLAADWCRRAGSERRPSQVLFYRQPIPTVASLA